MSFINPEFLIKSDQSNRTPADIFQFLKPLPNVIRFMRKWYPALLNASHHSMISKMRTISHTETSSVTCSSPFFFAFNSVGHNSDGSDSDDLEDQLSSNRKKSSFKSRKFTWQTLWNCFFPSSCLRCQQCNSLSRNLFQCFSSLVSKNSEEFSKIPFRCFFSSILLSLYYVVFVFYPLASSSSPTPVAQDPTPLYFTTLLYLLNLFGQLFMWLSFLITHFSGHSSSPPMPTYCHQEYYSSLTALVRFYSTTNPAPSSSPPPPSLCHSCRLLLPFRSKHCKELNRCLLTFDHYCYFIWTPISRQNYLYFFLYLIAMVLYIPIFLISSISYIRYHKPPSRFLAYFLLWCGLQWMFVLCLLYYFIQSISLGQTTYERIKKPFYLKSKYQQRKKLPKNGAVVIRNPFHRGSWWKNLWQHRLEMFSYSEQNQHENKDDLATKCHIYFQLEDLLKHK
jgi:hypothetical protein